MNKLIITLICFLTISSYAFTVDSVTVDSVWNSDSSWYDGQGILHQRLSLDCYVSFKPMGEGMAQCYIALSIDGGNTWAPNPSPIIVLDNGISTPILCGTKRQVKLRMLGGDRENIVFRITGRQYRPRMVSINGGTFQMRDDNYSVTVSDFKMSATEVTQELYTAVMGRNPSTFGGDTSALRPVEQVSWYDAAMFCNALSKLAGKDTVYSYVGSYMGSEVVGNFIKNGYRLPTEAEWEYACRAGTTTVYYWSNTWDTASANRYSWNCYTSNNKTQPVGTKLPNAWGLFDMAGNVWEWCNNWFGIDGDGSNPTVESSGYHRIVRGGCYYSGIDALRSACYNYANVPNEHSSNLGFRVVSRP